MSSISWSAHGRFHAGSTDRNERGFRMESSLARRETCPSPLAWRVPFLSARPRTRGPPDGGSQGATTGGSDPCVRSGPEPSMSGWGSVPQALGRSQALRRPGNARHGGGGCVRGWASATGPGFLVALRPRPAEPSPEPPRLARRFLRFLRPLLGSAGDTAPANSGQPPPAIGWT
jgi:hypothetical protein